MKYILSSLVFILSINVYATVKVAILDTGLDINKYNKKLCTEGHKDFTNEGLNDTNKYKHGTNIHGIIAEAEGDYCIVILKVFGDKNDPTKSTKAAIEYAIKIGVNIINYSGAGCGYDSFEALILREYLNKGGVFISASGNNRSNIDLIPVYPAMDDDRVIVIGNTDKRTSNYGKRVNRVIDGNDITGNGITLSGSSQSTAIYTKEYIEENEYKDEE